MHKCRLTIMFSYPNCSKCQVAVKENKKECTAVSNPYQTDMSKDRCDEDNNLRFPYSAPFSQLRSIWKWAVPERKRWREFLPSPWHAFQNSKDRPHTEGPSPATLSQRTNMVGIGTCYSTVNPLCEGHGWWLGLCIDHVLNGLKNLNLNNDWWLL